MRSLSSNLPRGARIRLRIPLWTLSLAGVLAAAGAAQGDVTLIREEQPEDYLDIQRRRDLEESSATTRAPQIYGPPAPVNARVAVSTGATGALEGAGADSTPVDSTAASGGENWEGRSQFSGLEPFGLEFFREDPGSFQAFDEIPVPADYRLGPGDRLVVNVWGRVDKTYELIVDREGKVFLPEAGAVVVWGLDMDQATQRLRNQLASIYSHFEINVMMGRVRSIRVYVYGEAKQTGSYIVSSLSTLMNVLHQAGGLTDHGSLRGVRLFRNGTLYRTVDLYRALVHGEGGDPDLILGSNDAIFIPVVGPRVGVDGEVNRPAIYELIGGETVADAIALAGGPTPEAYHHRVSIDRIAAGDRRVVFDIDYTIASQAASPVQDGDRVTLFRADEVREDVVQLAGWVKYPGLYGHRPGMRVSELLRGGEALRPESYLPRAVIRRPLPDGSFRLIPVDLTAALGPDLRRGALPPAPGLLAGEGDHVGLPAATRDPPPYTMSGAAAAESDPVLEPRDTVQIYSARDIAWSHWVSIDGEVKKPGRYELARDMRISDLLFEAGGLAPDADLSNAELVRLLADGGSQVLRVDLRRILLECDPSVDLGLEKDDALSVRAIPDRLGVEKVMISGEVRFPGSYSLTRRGELLSEVLARAGGVTEQAFVPGAVFNRASIAEEIDRQDVVPVFMSFRSDSATGAPMRAAPWLRGLTPELLPSRRMTIDLGRLLAGGPRRYDVPLSGGDELYVPRPPTAVPVMGHVAAVGSVQFVPGQSVGFYLDRAGGVTPDGHRRGIRVVRANGEVVKSGRGREILMGDAIVVPPRQQQAGNWRWLRDSFPVIAGAIATVLTIKLIN